MTAQEKRRPARGGAQSTTFRPEYRPTIPSLPDGKTLHGLALALMLDGREISTPAFIYSAVHGTRLPAYIHRLTKRGVPEDWIVSDALPLTQRQRRRSHTRPFHRYWLKPEAQAAMGERGRLWAAQALDYWRREGVRPEAFKAAPVSADDTSEGGK